MTPDRKYRESVRRLHVCCWFLAFWSFVLALIVLPDYPVAGVLFGFLAIGSLRIAAEVRDEMDRWGTPRSARPPAPIVACTSSTRPESPRRGQVIVETDTLTRWCWTGDEWVRRLDVVEVARGHVLMGPPR